MAVDASQKIILRNNAVDLAREIGKRASDLDIRGRLEIRIKTSIILWKYDEPIALQLLEMAWQDTFSDEIHNEFYANTQRHKIYSFAAKVAPEKAKKWLIKITEKKTDDEKPSDSSNLLTDRQKADFIIRSAIANLSANPQGSVSSAISSLDQTGRISTEFASLVDGLSALKRSDLISTVYQGVIGFTKERVSTEVQDFSAVMGLIVKSSATVENQNRLFEFLLNSGRQIVIMQNSNQNLPKLSTDELLVIYTEYVLFIKPFIKNQMIDSLPILDGLLRDLAAFIPPDKLSDPLRNPNPIETQIEDARKTVGSKERDIRFMKIASWLLSMGRRKPDETVYLKLAQSLADEITDIPTRENLRDFVKLVLIERSVAEKNYSDAEKTARSITSLEIKSWALMALGESQKMNIAASLDLYDAAQTTLKKSKPTPNKAQLSLILSSLLVKNDETKSLEILADAAKYSGQAEDVDEKAGEKNWNYLYISSYIGGRNFTSTDLVTKTSEIFIPGELGKLAIVHWDMATDTSKKMQPLRLQLNLQLILANSALESVGEIKKQSHESIKNP